MVGWELNQHRHHRHLHVISYKRECFMLAIAKRCKKNGKGKNPEALNSTRSFTVKKKVQTILSIARESSSQGKAEMRDIVIITLMDFISPAISLRWIGIDTSGPILILFHRLHLVLTVLSPSICTHLEKEEKKNKFFL